MTTKILVDSSICGYKTLITARMDGEGIKINLESGCSHIKKYNESLVEVNKRDLYKTADNIVIKGAAKSNISPSCIVPAGIINACWIESGLISKNLALDKKELRIIFKE